MEEKRVFLFRRKISLDGLIVGISIVEQRIYTTIWFVFGTLGKQVHRQCESADQRFIGGEIVHAAASEVLRIAAGWRGEELLRLDRAKANNVYII